MAVGGAQHEDRRRDGPQHRRPTSCQRARIRRAVARQPARARKGVSQEIREGVTRTTRRPTFSARNFEVASPRDSTPTRTRPMRRSTAPDGRVERSVRVARERQELRQRGGARRPESRPSRRGSQRSGPRKPSSRYANAKARGADEGVTRCWGCCWPCSGWSPSAQPYWPSSTPPAGGYLCSARTWACSRRWASRPR